MNGKLKDGLVELMVNSFIFKERVLGDSQRRRRSDGVRSL
jgi:hypothetical protein